MTWKAFVVYDEDGPTDREFVGERITNTFFKKKRGGRLLNVRVYDASGQLIEAFTAPKAYSFRKWLVDTEEQQ